MKRSYIGVSKMGLTMLLVKGVRLVRNAYAYRVDCISTTPS